MVVKPTVPLVIGLWVGYLVVWIGSAAALAPDGANFGDAFEDLANSRYLAYGLLAASFYGAVVATLFGWWRGIFADDREHVAGVTGWHRFVPVMALVLIFATTDYPGLADIDVELLGWIIAASVLVGVAAGKENEAWCVRASHDNSPTWLWIGGPGWADDVRDMWVWRIESEQKPQ